MHTCDVLALVDWHLLALFIGLAVVGNERRLTHIRLGGLPSSSLARGALHRARRRWRPSDQPQDAHQRRSRARRLAPARPLRRPFRDRPRAGGLGVYGHRALRPARHRGRPRAAGAPGARRLLPRSHGGEPARRDAPPPLRATGADGAGHALALASTFAGTTVLVGSIANLIVVEQATRLGVRIGFRDQVRLALLTTLVSMAIAAAALLLG